VAIGHYTDSAESSYELSSSTSSVSSDAVAFYLTHRLGGFDLRSRFSISDDNHATSEHDELIGVTSSTSFGGRTTELAQRAGYPLDFAGATWTPWAEVTRRVQEVDSYSIANPYLSDVTYSGAEAGETLAGIGLDARFEPLELSDAASLGLHGGIAYTHSLSRDDYVVQITESAGTGPAQEQRIERDPIRQLALTLGGSLELGDDLSIGAEVALAHAADEGSAQQAQLRVQYRF
jgi:outer membrane autotransporter protein